MPFFDCSSRNASVNHVRSGYFVFSEIVPVITLNRSPQFGLPSWGLPHLGCWHCQWNGFPLSVWTLSLSQRGHRTPVFPQRWNIRKFFACASVANILFKSLNFIMARIYPIPSQLSAFG